ncbi:transporter substrate-binding domain-containing protein [Rhodococcus sp. Z13]|uniref:Transporter substrate-binding domain-containing protein n=1 Tax=Rhodococcus sacchari TaxID=2962047 RepID=A0ACD4DEA4_9NOCA|nr:transporter substrate-binding domain-containing protein [Rhodococcus sp. Z13]UYP18354.1 transporter substrate-binding domain-containing protein [Rhodococcus sp. Z13]
MSRTIFRSFGVRSASLAGLALAATVGLTACSSSDSDADDATAESVATEYTVAVQSAWPPIGFLEGEELQGVAIDVAAELSERLNIDFTFEKPAFADMIPGVQSGRYDFGLWSADVTAERMQIVDQVSWMKSGYYLEAPAGSAIQAGDDLTGICGLTVALVQGQTTQVTLEEVSQKCVADGKDPITLSTFPDQPSSELAVKSGRADVATVGSQTFGYTESIRPGEWMRVSALLNPVYNGMVFPEGSDIAPQIADAVNELIADGTYAEILEKWNVSDSAIERAEVDPEI